MGLDLRSVEIEPLPGGHTPARSLYLRSTDSTLPNTTNDLVRKLKRELQDKILHKGNVIKTRLLGKDLTFSIDSIEAMHILSLSDQMHKLSLADQQKHQFFKVSLDTEIKILDEYAPVESKTIPIIGGLDKIIKEIFDLIHNATTRPLKSGWINNPSRGLILYGPSGCGKSLICQYLTTCDELKAFKFIQIASSQIFSKYLGESEVALQKPFAEAKKNHPQPTIIILEDLHILCSKNENSDLNRRMISAVLNCLDDLSTAQQSNRTMVICTTTQIENLESSLLRSGRLDSSIEVPIPTPEARFDILTKVTSAVAGSQLSPEQIQSISKVTHGFLGADLVSLISKAVSMAPGNQSISVADVNSALNYVKPNAMLEIQIEVPTVRWSDIGGQHELKLKLQQSVDWPLRNPEVFHRFGIKPPKGVLMYGPPGCSKTMIAKALATESKLNFLSIKGPELFSMWVGESERAVRELFRKARSVAPAIIFFDEIDAIGGERSQGSGGGGGGSSVNERVLAQLLTEMDGVTALDNVTIVAATNRPDMIDKALLRPGRIDRVIHVRLPDEETRREIFNLKLKSLPVAEDVSVDELVRLTEGYSGAEIQAICQEAALKTLEESLEAKSVEWRHVLDALVAVKPRTSKDLLELYERYEDQFKN